jgi:hypothetical protein
MRYRVPKIGLILVQFILQTANATEHDKKIALELAITGRAIRLVSQNGRTESGPCLLPKTYKSPKLSFDKSAVILSDREYFGINSIKLCKQQPIRVNRIKSGVGTLIDINIPANLFLALDVISTSPLSFLATVAHLKSSRNLIDLPGAYVSNRNLKALQEQGFSYNAEFSQPRISISGRYVTPSGEVDCSENAYPGVWDLRDKKRVVFQNPISDAQAKCEALFRPIE